MMCTDTHALLYNKHLQPYAYRDKWKVMFTDLSSDNCLLGSYKSHNAEF
jgi:hypothetical protein